MTIDKDKEPGGCFKICLIGAPKTGKTSFFNYQLTCKQAINYCPTVSFNVKSLFFSTDCGNYELSIWDLPGHTRCQKSEYYLHSSAALAFYTLSTITETNELVANFKKACPNVPIFNIWSFSDLKETASISPKIRSQSGRPTYQTSSQVETDDTRLWTDLLRTLTQKPQLELIKNDLDKVD